MKNLLGEKNLIFLVGIVFSLPFLILILTFLNKFSPQKRRARKNLLEDLEKNSFNLDIGNYEINLKNKKRGAYLDRLFKRKWLFDQLEVFGHQCAHCDREESEVQLTQDHFFIPKSMGGTLMVKHRRGYWVCNAILLCAKCNREKSDSSPKDFFSESKYLTIKEKVISLSLIMNEINE